jgi:hypothetical protein
MMAADNRGTIAGKRGRRFGAPGPVFLVNLSARVRGCPRPFDPRKPEPAQTARPEATTDPATPAA